MIIQQNLKFTQLIFDFKAPKRFVTVLKKHIGKNYYFINYPIIFCWITYMVELHQHNIS